jgi:hypothetical protein
MQYVPTVRVPHCAILFIPLIALRAMTSRTRDNVPNLQRAAPSLVVVARLTAQASAMLSIRRVVPIRAAMTRRAPASAVAGGSIVSASTTSA